MNYQQTPAAGAASAAHADGDQQQASPRRNNGCSDWATSSHAGHSQILRPYQETAVDDIEAALDEGEKVLYCCRPAAARLSFSPISSSVRCKPASGS
jgi:hypothetical protein